MKICEYNLKLFAAKRFFKLKNSNNIRIFNFSWNELFSKFYKAVGSNKLQAKKTNRKSIKLIDK